MNAKCGALEQSIEHLQRQQIEDRCRSRARIQISADKFAAMVAEFAASHGGFTICPPAYAVVSRQYH